MTGIPMKFISSLMRAAGPQAGFIHISWQRFSPGDNLLHKRLNLSVRSHDKSAAMRADE